VFVGLRVSMIQYRYDGLSRLDQIALDNQVSVFGFGDF